MKKIGQTTRSNHFWVTVVNPTNHRMLLQACDHCGVVKSENSVARSCLASRNQSLISESLSSNFSVSA